MPRRCPLDPSAIALVASFGAARVKKKPTKTGHCMHCGKPKATIPIHVGKITLLIHATCRAERTALATNGASVRQS